MNVGFKTLGPGMTERDPFVSFKTALSNTSFKVGMVLGIMVSWI
jgi:hypothetical protein